MRGSSSQRPLAAGLRVDRHFPPARRFQPHPVEFLFERETLQVCTALVLIQEDRTGGKIGAEFDLAVSRG